MAMKKTGKVAIITQVLCGKKDVIQRRVWTDGENFFVKVNGMWFDLYRAYGRSKHHSVETFYSPASR